MLAGAKKLSSGCGMRWVVLLYSSLGRPPERDESWRSGPLPPRPACGERCVTQLIGSRHQLERHAAERERIARDRMALGPGGIEHLAGIGDLERQPAHDLAVA